MVKRIRAYGGCLGTGRRRRSWQAAISCGEEQASIDPQITESENRLQVNLQHLLLNTQATEEIPGELKHLSTPRKRNQKRFPKQWRANGEEPKPIYTLQAGAAVRSVLQDVNGAFSRTLGELQNFMLAEPAEKRAKEGDSPVSESMKVSLVYIPEQGGARETLLESGRTTFQG